MSLEIRNAPGQPGYALLVFNRELDAGSLKLAIQNRMSRKYLGRSVGKANWSPARSHFFDATLASCGDGETIFMVGPEVASFIPDEASVEFTSEDNAICEQAVWRGILHPLAWTASDADPEAEAEVKPQDINERGREYRSVDTGTERGIGIGLSPFEHAVPAQTPTAEQAVSRTPLRVETSDEKLDQLIAAFAGELETEAVMDSAQSKTRSFHDDQVEAKMDAPGLVDETMQIAQTLADTESEARARRTKSATDWLLLFTTLGFLYLGIKLGSPNGNGSLFFIFVAAGCGIWWISRLKVGSGNRTEDKST